MEMKKLTKRLLRCFVKMEVINMDDITMAPYEDVVNQLENADIEVGEEARTLADSLCVDGMEPEVIRFFNHVRLLYSMFVKMLIIHSPQQFCLT